jgi:hypothetical protein
LPEQLTQLSCGSSSNSSEKVTKVVERSVDENRSTRRKSEQSIQDQYFNQDLKIHSVDDVLNLDNYAEKLLQKCDLLLSGYNTTSKERSSRSPNYDFGKKASEGSETRIREDQSFAVRNKQTSNFKRPMTVSESQETVSSYDTDSKSEAASDEISGDSDDTDRLLQLLQSRSHATPRFSKSKLELDLEGKGRPVSPLGSSFDANTLTLNWTGQRTQVQTQKQEHEHEYEYEYEKEKITQLSLHGKKNYVGIEHSSSLNIRNNSVALQAVCAPSASTRKNTSVPCMTVAIPDNIMDSAGDRELIPKKKGNSIKFNSTEAEYDTLEPTLSASLVFPAGYKMGRDDRHGSDSFLYVSSSSEMDASVRAVSAARLRHSGVSNYDGGDVYGPKSAIRFVGSNGDGRVMESVDGLNSGENSSEKENEKENENGNEKEKEYENENENENNNENENENRSTNFHDDDGNRKTSHNDNNSNRSKDDIDTYNNNGYNVNDHNDSNNDRNNNDDDESLRGSRIIEIDKTATIINTHTACNDSDTIPVTSDQKNEPSVSTSHTAHVHVPLLEADVAPYLDDEITMLLWQRLCSVRGRLRNLKVQDPQL